MISVSKLPYMLAILNESLRMFPAVVNGIPRLIGPGGDIIIGQYIHEGTTVDIWHWAVYRNPDHFAQPNDFIQSAGSGILVSIMMPSEHYSPSPSAREIASERISRTLRCGSF
ncbi:hypothetical protein NCS55_00965300 [Fusarium keratoplasticum]|nr:hypothetical protein NCS55_00965300 [Fusarium keratoplasticum]